MFSQLVLSSSLFFVFVFSVVVVLAVDNVSLGDLRHPTLGVRDDVWGLARHTTRATTGEVSDISFQKVFFFHCGTIRRFCTLDQKK